MDIQTFIAKGMMAGFSYEASWGLLGYAIQKGLFDKMCISEDESAFPDMIQKLADELFDKKDMVFVGE